MLKKNLNSKKYLLRNLGRHSKKIYLKLVLEYLEKASCFYFLAPPFPTKLVENNVYYQKNDSPTQQNRAKQCNEIVWQVSVA
jgi:hypothetical protein